MVERADRLTMPELAPSVRQRVDPGPTRDRPRTAIGGPVDLPKGLESLNRGSARGRGTSAAHLLALQRAAGNRNVAASFEATGSDEPSARATPTLVVGTANASPIRRTGQRSPGARLTSLQRAPVATPKHPVNSQGARNDVLDLLNGFEDLAGAAVNDGGRHLDSIHFGSDLGTVHRNLLERIRTALIEAQEKSPDARRAAVAQWPALETRLTEAIDQARKMGFPADFLATVASNLAAIGEMYVHAPHRGGSRIETAADYIDVLNGLNDLVGVLRQQRLDKTDAVVATNIGATNKKQREDLGNVKFGDYLTPQHRQLLETVRTAFILVRTETPGSPAAALSAWRAVQGDLRLAMKRMPKFLVDPTDRSTLHLGNDAAELATTLNGLGTALFVGGAYTEAHAKAIKDTNLQAPDLVLQVARYKEAVRELSEAEKLANKGLQLTGEDAISAVLSGEQSILKGEGFEQTGHEIFELVKAPGEIAEKLEKWKEQGKLGKAVTVAEIADKVSSMARATASLSCESVKRFAEAMEKKYLAQGAEKLAEKWGDIGKAFKSHLDMLKKIGKVATVITVVISVVRIVDLLSEGKIAEAASEAASTVANLAASLATGAGGAALIGGIEVVIAAEIEGLRGAAAMIKYCKDHNVHSAAMSFIDICKSAADIEARDLVADAKLLPETKDPAERAVIETRLAGYLPYWMRHVEGLSNLIRNDRPSELGGQPEVRDALGTAALQILNNPSSWGGSWQAMAEQIRILFAGANSMTKYVDDHYDKHEDAEPKEE